MSAGSVVSRRALLAGLFLATTSLARAQIAKGVDQGIGGTGISGGDQGIGGTGIVGVIQRFGSIFVNGQRVSYAANVPVTIDGVQVPSSSLKIGHVVRVLAQPQARGGLATRRIAVTSEVRGAIEAVNNDEFTVLGQRVAWSQKAKRMRVGDRVAVFGLRRADGTIAASLVEPQRLSGSSVTGVVEGNARGLRMGGLSLTNVDPALVGRRVRIEGTIAKNVLHASRTSIDDLSDLAGASRFSIEGYVHRDGDRLVFGAGYAARDGSRIHSMTGESRVIVNATSDGRHGLQVQSVQATGHFSGSSLLNPGSPAGQRGAAPQGGNGPGGGGPGGNGPGGAAPGGRPSGNGEMGPAPSTGPGGDPFDPGRNSPFGPGGMPGGFGGGPGGGRR